MNVIILLKWFCGEYYLMWNKIFIIIRVLWSVIYYKKGIGFSFGIVFKFCV